MSEPAKRKVIQILTYTKTDRPPTKLIVCILALCDDGTLWVKGADEGWIQRSTPPGT